MWRGYQSCGEVTQPPVARLPNLWRGYLVARLQSCYSPIFRWNQQSLTTFWFQYLVFCHTLFKFYW